MKDRIPFWLLVVMTMNIMMGSGVFINPAALARLAGPFSALSYVVVAVLILPLVLVVAQLAKMHQAVSGGLYEYNKSGLGSSVGIVSALSYFFAKVIACSIMIRMIVTYLHSLAVPGIYLGEITAVLLVFLLGFNLLGMRFGSKVQFGFVVLKVIPIVSVTLLAITTFTPEHFTIASPSIGNFSSSLPIALFALMGFEACCSIGHTSSGSATISRVVVVSFVAVAILYGLFQCALFAGAGMDLVTSATPLSGFFKHISTLLPTAGFVSRPLLDTFIMCSMFGSCYGMMQVNTWNMYAVFEELCMRRVLPQSLVVLNGYGMPIYVVFIHTVLLTIFTYTMLPIVFAQRLVVLGTVVCYTLSVLALLKLYHIRQKAIALPYWVTLTALGSCMYIGFCLISDLLS